jgi:hypothetical protein
MLNVTRNEFRDCVGEVMSFKGKGLWIRLYYASGQVIDGVIPNSLLLDLTKSIKVIIKGDVKTVRIGRLARIEVMGVLKELRN